MERHGLLCISGLTAETYSPERKSYIVNSTSLVEQTGVIFKKMGAILEAASYVFEDVVYTVDYALDAAIPRIQGQRDGKTRKLWQQYAGSGGHTR